MVVNTITEAKAQLSALVERAARGEEIIISKSGTPVAVLAPYSSATGVRQPGRLRGKIRIADDFDTLPGDIADAFGAGSQ
jgi:prevent-host-death family protein